MEDGEKKIKNKQNFWIFTMASAYALCSAGNACINPYYPTTAMDKGVSESVIGIIMCLVFSPQLILMFVNNKLLIRMGPIWMLRIGLILTFSSTVAFGFTDCIPSKPLFIFTCIFLKLVQGVGFSFIPTAAVFIASEHIPDKMSLVIGLLATGNGFGYAMGPLIGGYFNDKLGYASPLLIVGVLQLFFFLLSFISMKSISNKSTSSLLNDGSTKMNFKIFQKIPVLLVLLAMNTLAFIVLCTYDISIPEYGSEILKRSSTDIGYHLFIPGIGYAMFATAVGNFIDKMGYELIIVEVGLLSTALSMLLLAYMKTYSNLSLLIFVLIYLMISFSSSLYYVPILSLIKKTISEQGIVIDRDLNALISSMMMTFLIIGELIGVGLGGGLFYEYLGTTYTAILYAVFSALMALILYVGIKRSSRQNYSSLES